MLNNVRQWVTMAAMTTKRASFIFLSRDQNYVWALGGRSGSYSVTSKISRYTVSTNTWKDRVNICKNPELPVKI